MAYIPTEWKDRVVENPRTYTVQENEDGTITLIPEPGMIYEPGTPLNAPNMNNIEQGVAAADAHAARTDNPHNVTKAQVGLGNVTNVASSTAATANQNAQRDANGDLTSRRFISNVANGTAPFGVTSATKVANLNVDRVDDIHFRVNAGAVEYSTDGNTWTGVGGVKSVQRGSLAMATGGLTVDVSISAVNINKAFVNLNFVKASETLTLNAELTSSTNLRFNKTSAPISAPYEIKWEVIEFY